MVTSLLLVHVLSVCMLATHQTPCIRSPSYHAVCGEIDVLCGLLSDRHGWFLHNGSIHSCTHRTACFAGTAIYAQSAQSTEYAAALQKGTTIPPSSHPTIQASWNRLHTPPHLRKRSRRFTRLLPAELPSSRAAEGGMRHEA